MRNLVKVVMPVLQGKKEIVVGSKISQAEYDAFQEICEREDRSMSYVLRELAIRGMAQYWLDGRLKPTLEEEKSIMSVRSSFKGEVEFSGRIKPKVQTKAGQEEKPKDVRGRIDSKVEASGKINPKTQTIPVLSESAGENDFKSKKDKKK